jgi:S-adenosylmethionine:tRNA ribosyltransferase-isomerase
VKTELFDYSLPAEAIARRPTEQRDGARLLVLEGERRTHRRMAEFGELVPEGALLVLNDTRVRRARVFGKRRPGGGRVELLFLEASGASADGRERWRALGRANKPLLAGTLVEAPQMVAEVLSQGEGGVLELAIAAEGGVEAVLEREGHVPIPPYLEREDEVLDRDRYQTVYARRTSSVAAPTAGLHLTDAILRRLSERGVQTARLELSVGLGTFRPVSVEDLDQHPMHVEAYEVPADAALAVREARARNKPVVAVGTTVVRALESAAEDDGTVRAGAGTTRLLIQPGYAFRVVDSLLTNFHQPKSTLLALVTAFAGYDATFAAYREALAEGYRFLSYGDALWIPRRAA